VRDKLAALSATAAIAGCAFVPAHYPRLDEAHAAYAQGQSTPEITCLAPSALAEATDALDKADKARDTLDDPAHVDHLAYIAMRRAMIATETAKRAARRWECR
jgi:Domain of unknown function (DUF4398)